MIILTEQASLKVKEMLQEVESNEQQYLRVDVQDGGCTGFSYSMGFDEEQHDDDTTIEQHGVKIIINNKISDLIKGTTIDFKESMMGGGFSIDNPNASLTCGCGVSFRTLKDAGKPGDC